MRDTITGTRPRTDAEVKRLRTRSPASQTWLHARLAFFRSEPVAAPRRLQPEPAHGVGPAGRWYSVMVPPQAPPPSPVPGAAGPAAPGLVGERPGGPAEGVAERADPDPRPAAGGQPQPANSRREPGGASSTEVRLQVVPTRYCRRSVQCRVIRLAGTLSTTPAARREHDDPAARR